MDQELIYFKNTNTLDEPLFDSPMGSLSIRQVGITGVGCLMIAMYALTQVQLGVIPLIIIPLLLGLGHRGNMTMDQYIMSWLMFKIRGSSTSLIKNSKKDKTKRKKEKDVPQAMQIHSKSKTITKIKSKLVERKIEVSRLDETTRLSIKCTTNDGEPLKNKAVRVLLDDVSVFDYTTNSLGEMAAVFKVKELGKKKLRIMAKNIEAPLVEGTLNFVLKDNRRSY